MTATAAAIKRLDDLFQTIRLDEQTKAASSSTSKKRSKEERVHFSPMVVISKDCDIHGRKSYAGTTRSTTNLNGIGGGRRNTTTSTIGPRRESMPAGLNTVYRKSPTPALASLSRETLVHPSAFSSTLRKDNVTASVGSLKRNSVSSRDGGGSRRNLAGLSSSNVSSAAAVNGNGVTRREANGSIARRDYVNGSLASSKKDLSRMASTDSLESFKRTSFDFNRRNSSSSSSAGLEDPIWEENSKTTCRQDGDGQSNGGGSSVNEINRPKFLSVTTLEDVQAVRCAEFHPRGTVYAVGSNSKILRICAYPNLSDLREDHTPCQPTVLFKRTRHHKGSIYCMTWTPDGDLLATGSNDKTVKLMRFNIDTANLEGQEIELAMHDGTVRDVCFIEDTSNKSSLLISGGAGDCKIYVTDCATGQAFQALSGHTDAILTLYNWGGAVFASGSQDQTVRMWDLRSRGCTNVITPVTSPGTRQRSPVTAICVDPSGRLLVSGHEDSACVLYDIRGSRALQSFRPHTSQVRSIRFSPSAYYLLSGGYDNKLVLTDLQGDLTASLPSVVVAQHQDKVISGRWHPAEFSFLSSSADKTATLWALPPV